MGTSLMDAPWIWQAENDGIDYGDDPICPCCYEECEHFYKIGRDIIGCENCIEVVEAYSQREEVHG